MITEEDIKRLEKVVTTSSTFGEKINYEVVKVSKLLCSKVGLVVLGTVIGICYFIVGLFGRRDR